MLKINKNVAFMPYQNYQYTNYQDFIFPEYLSKFVFECGEFF